MPLYQVSGGTPYKRGALGGLSQLFGSYAQGQQAREERLRQQQMQDLQMRLLRRQMGQIGQPAVMHPLEEEERRKRIGLMGLPSPTSEEEAANLRARTGLILAQTGQMGKPTPISPEELANLKARTGLTMAQTGQVGQPSPMSEIEIQQLMANIEATQALAQERRGKVPSIGERVSTEMGKYEPGSEEWNRLAKIMTPETTIRFPSGTERTAIAETRASIDALDNLAALFNENYVGPAQGRMGTLKDSIGLNPIEQSSFYAATAAFKNAIIKEITGAQMSEIEANRILKQVPVPTDPANVWWAKWQQSKINLTFLQNRRMEILRQTGIIMPSGEEGMPTAEPNMPPPPPGFIID